MADRVVIFDNIRSGKGLGAPLDPKADEKMGEMK